MVASAITGGVAGLGWGRKHLMQHYNKIKKLRRPEITLSGVSKVPERGKNDS